MWRRSVCCCSSSLVLLSFRAPARARPAREQARLLSKYSKERRERGRERERERERESLAQPLAFFCVWRRRVAGPLEVQQARDELLRAVVGAFLGRVALPAGAPPFVFDVRFVFHTKSIQGLSQFFSSHQSCCHDGITAVSWKAHSSSPSEFGTSSQVHSLKIPTRKFHIGILSLGR